MDVHPTKNGISRYWSIPIFVWCPMIFIVSGQVLRRLPLCVPRGLGSIRWSFGQRRCHRLAGRLWTWRDCALVQIGYEWVDGFVQKWCTIQNVNVNAEKSWLTWWTTDNHRKIWPFKIWNRKIWWNCHRFLAMVIHHWILGVSNLETIVHGTGACNNTLQHWAQHQCSLSVSWRHCWIG
jgi:hypothetical protein